MSVGRLQIGVVFRRDISTSGRQISKCMVLWWLIDRPVEKTWCCSGTIVGKINNLTCIADIFRQNEITRIERNCSMIFALMKQILYDIDNTKVSMMRFLGEEFSNHGIFLTHHVINNV